MKNEKLKEILESPIAQGLVAGAAGAGTYAVGCMGMTVFEKTPVGRFFDIITLPAGIAILCGALFVAISTIAYKRIADLRASESGFVQHCYMYDTLIHARISEEDKT